MGDTEHDVIVRLFFLELFIPGNADIDNLQVTSTPYSSHENLNCSDADMPDLSPAEVKNPLNFLQPVHLSMNLKIPPYMIISTQAPLGPPLPCSSSPAATAEAPELSYGEVCFTEWCVKINQYKIQNVGIYWTIIIRSSLTHCCHSSVVRWRQW